MDYKPPQKILEKYADLLVNFALGGGKGIKPGDVVYLQVPLTALPLYREIQKAIIKAGGLMPIGGVSDNTSGFSRYFLENANERQLTTFMAKYSRGLADQIDHRLAIISDYNMRELRGVDPAKMMLFQKSRIQLSQWLDHKEKMGSYTWTVGLYATPAMAKEAGMSLKGYWRQIINACYLDKADPKAEWAAINNEIDRVSRQLTGLKIESLHVKGPDEDLHVKIGQDRKWVGGGGANVPSFEVFTSPDWRGTEGWVRFNQPLYHYGDTIKGIELHFEQGRVVKATARANQKLLDAILNTDEGARQLGEFSLTDKRLSRVTRFMAETLFDENTGGPYGNTHVALGRSFHETYNGSKPSKALLKSRGFNDSAIHNDMISTADRIVTATLAGGKQKIIYSKGQFQI